MYSFKQRNNFRWRINLLLLRFSPRNFMNRKLVEELQYPVYVQRTRRGRQRAVILEVKQKMAEIVSQGEESSRTSVDAVSFPGKDMNTSIKRACSRSPSPECPLKSPRSTQPEPGMPTPEAEGRHMENQEEMQVEDRQQKGEMMEQERKGDGPALSPRSRRKSWRRSARLRRSFPALPGNAHALCREISPSVPEEERLEKLMESSMQQAVVKLQQSLHSTPGASLERLQEQVEMVQADLWRVTQAIREQAQSQPCQTSTESDPDLQKTMDQIRTSIQSLQTECGLWDSLLLRHRSKAEELARRVKQGQAEGVALDASCLAESSQGQFILNKPDYHSALLRQQTVLQTMELLMDCRCKMMQELLSFQEQCRMLVKETSKRLASSAGFQDLQPSPIRRLLAKTNCFKHDPLTSDTARCSVAMTMEQI
ncbi:hypothetical protein GJAV_G00220440 [Gymnothorax javanicus]|nr:hypothetical protein GJAV_G00220440 [Gymnothorax javanicus]